jgi:uncharacterized protein (TIGR02271 family)
MSRKKDFDHYSEHRRPASADGYGRQSKVIPVIEEQVQVGKRVRETGSVRISKKVHQEEVTVDEPIVQEHVEVERVPVNQYVDIAPPAIRYEGDKMIISVLEEVVEKRLILVEEIHITKQQEKTHDPQKVTLRKEELRVERISGDPNRTAERDPA